MNQGQSGIALETIAAITAAVAAAMDQPVGSFVITGIQPVAAAGAAAQSGWVQAGLLERHLAMRQFGQRR